MYYIVKPTLHLTKLINEEFSEYKSIVLPMWHTEVIWEVHEGYSLTYPYPKPEILYTPRLKLIILANIAYQYDRFKNTRMIIERCFGEPPIFDIERFDQLWTLKAVQQFKNFGRTIIGIKTKYLTQVQKTGDSELDEWFFKNLIGGIKLPFDELEEGSPEKERKLKFLESILIG